MKQKIISLFLAVVCAASLAVPASAASSTPFKDLDETKWYYVYAKDLYDDGIINGVSSTCFDPDGPVTLAQALKLFLLIGGYEEQTPTTTHWASGYYHLANSKGYLGSARSLSLDQPLNRLQIADLAANILGLSRTNHDLSPFSDTRAASVLALYDYGIITGEPTDSKKPKYRPLSRITRAELSALVYRIKELGLDTQSTIDLSNLSDYDNPPDKPEPVVKPDPADKTESVPGTPDTPTYSPTETSFTFNGRTLSIKSNVPRNLCNTSLFKRDKNGYMTYGGTGYDYRIGIDVSRYQGDIDWAAVKKAGVQFAIIRVGYRGYGQKGTLVQDSCFQRNLKGALAQGIPVGVYFFSQAVSKEEAIEEANYVLERIKGYDISLPVVFDWEPYPASKKPRTLNLSDKVLTKCAVAFCETVKSAGYEPMVYSNLSYFYLHFDLAQLADYPLWLAQYNTKPTFRYNFSIWQYTSRGSVPGIKGDTDLDIMLLPKT